MLRYPAQHSVPVGLKTTRKGEADGELAAHTAITLCKEAVQGLLPLRACRGPGDEGASERGVVYSESPERRRTQKAWRALVHVGRRLEEALGADAKHSGFSRAQAHSQPCSGHSCAGGQQTHPSDEALLCLTYGSCFSST